MMEIRRWLADGLVSAAASRLRRRHPEWAEAMMSEHASLADHRDQLGWAFGSLRASFALEGASYPALLVFALVAMTIYQWSADESLLTLSLMGALALLLGLLRPSRFVVSGVLIGVVVAAVNGFETASGVRPAYEIYDHSWMHNARWLLLIPPAIASSAIGRQLASLLQD